jgi:hypothetical protein
VCADACDHRTKACVCMATAVYVFVCADACDHRTKACVCMATAVYVFMVVLTHVTTEQRGVFAWLWLCMCSCVC